ncbi:hypothetical protein BOX15_Mlig011119g5, partial [Macrostomum lignano]
LQILLSSMSEEIASLLVAAAIDGTFWLLFRSLSRRSEAELQRLESCQIVPEGQPVASLVKDYPDTAKELPELVAFSGTLAPQSVDEVVARDGLRCIAFEERHAQVSRDGNLRRLLYSESRVPRLVAIRRLAASALWPFGSGNPVDETVQLREAQSANGFGRLFQRRRDHRVPLADSSSGDYFHITESVIPAGLTLNFMGALSFDPLSRQLNLRLLEVGFTDMAELIDSAKDTCSTYNFFRGACRLTTLLLLALAAKRAYKLFMQRRNGPPPPPPPPRPPQPPSTSSSNNSQQAQSEQKCGICFDRPLQVVLVDCGHALCKQCAASVSKCPFCSKPKLGRPVPLYLP